MDFPISCEALGQARCVPCEGGVPVLAGEELKPYLAAVDAWKLDESGRSISRKVNCGNFVRAVELIGKIADVAEQEQHHPDLHLTGYRHLEIRLTTHAIGGLSENDFILAAKLDPLFS